MDRWYELFGYFGGYIPKVKVCKKDRFDSDESTFVLNLLEADPSLYLREIQNALVDAGFRKIPLCSIYRHLKRRNLSLVNLSYRASQASKAAAVEYWQWMVDIKAQSRQMLFIDETHTSRTAFRRRRGWKRRGTKFPLATRFFVNSKPCSVIAAFNLDGFLEDCLQVEYDTVDGDTFLKYFEEKVTPTLGNYERGEKNSLVLMDNWSGHRKAEVTAVMEELCTSKGALLRFLPAYQPWLNPIEFGFGLFRHHLKSKTAYLRQRDHDIKFETHQALMTAFAAITQTNAASFFKRSGYHVPRQHTTSRKRKMYTDVAAVMLLATAAVVALEYDS